MYFQHTLSTILVLSIGTMLMEQLHIILIPEALDFTNYSNREFFHLFPVLRVPPALHYSSTESRSSGCSLLYYNSCMSSSFQPDV